MVRLLLTNVTWKRIALLHVFNLSRYMNSMKYATNVFNTTPIDTVISRQRQGHKMTIIYHGH